MVLALTSLILWLCAYAQLASSRAYAASDARLRVLRRGLAVTCGGFALMGFGRFVYFILLMGHPWRSMGVLIGQTVAVTFLVLAILLWKPTPPRRPWALVLAVWCAFFASLALARLLNAF